MQQRGFTLIELLIVVAIIAILAAIAVPNFLEAQVRAKVSRVASDLRTLKTALESYRVDNNEYPPSFEDDPNGRFYPLGDGWFAYVGRLSTPTSYITGGIRDPFHVGDDLPFGYDFYQYWSEPLTPVHLVAEDVSTESTQYLLWSYGPDREDNWDTGFWAVQYDSTNGTMSSGNIYRIGP